MLGLEEVLEDVAEEGSLALAEVLALGGLAVIAAGCTGGCAGGGAVVLVMAFGAGRL